MKRLLVVSLLTLAVLAAGSVPARNGLAAPADSGWSITSFQADYTVATDGSISVVEDLKVNFNALVKHGIFRDINQQVPCVQAVPGAQAATYPCPAGRERVYTIEPLGVSDGLGHAVPYTTGTVGSALQLKIGDPNRTVTGVQTYQIRYRVIGALDAYSDHDELNWNASAKSTVPIETTSITLHLPPGAALKVHCNLAGKIDPQCAATANGNFATYVRNVPLQPGQELQIVAGWQKGLVQVAPPVTKRVFSIRDLFTFDVWEWSGMAVIAILSVLALIALWWRHGRDRRYRTLFYLTNDPSEETRPLFGHTDIVVEYTPPDDLRPAEMGLILDERADPLDVTATIVDLAVRGYLHITEIPKEGIFGHQDWKLTRVEADESQLRPYESKLYAGLFESGSEVELSSLQRTFTARLSQVEEALYDDGMERKWFLRRPGTSRTLWGLAGLGVAVAGVVLSLAIGLALSRALIAAPIVVAGMALAGMSRAMARRTATGSEALRRVLGFRLYITTAETRRQEFNEQQGIFARYLPFAIVFGCVNKWAKAFEGLDDPARSGTASWYTGVGAFEVAAFASGFQGFSETVSSSISSSASSGGGSGFSGGFGGGGGSVGSW